MSSFTRTRHFPSRSAGALGAADFLRSHERLAALLPAVTRMVALQKDCAKCLPTMFQACDIAQFENEQLVLSTPNAAVAAKLKQQLPKLQEDLNRLGWQVNAIRLKVQVGKTVTKSKPPKQLALPGRAIAALVELEQSLEKTPQNGALLAAVAAMVARHRT